MSKKILMALMGLEIGGAETHAVELCKELRRRGDEVIVVSNGGVYEKELAEAGVRCYAAPLNRRSIPLMLRSLGILRRVIREERPDVVHAHARIPAFLCGLLQRTMRFPFVTTAHGVFEVNPVLKKLSSWGERTIAVSDDIRDYLVNSYGLPREQILGTINGIDTQRFSPETSDERIRREFDLPANGKTIVHVSRIDASSTMVTRQLVAIAPRLAVHLCHNAHERGYITVAQLIPHCNIDSVLKVGADGVEQGHKEVLVGQHDSSVDSRIIGCHFAVFIKRIRKILRI